MNDGERLVRELRFISSLDTVHDFAELKTSGNSYYVAFTTRIVKPSTMGDVSQSAASVEEELMKHYRMNDASLPTFDLRTMSFVNGGAGVLDSKKFKVIIPSSELYSDEFKIWLSTLLIETTRTLNFVTDTTNISEDVMCSMQFGQSQGRILLTDATSYDRGVAPQRSKCKQYEPEDIRITQEEGLLTTLQSVRIEDKHFHYTLPDGSSASFNIDSYVKSLGESHLSKKLPFYIQLIYELAGEMPNKMIGGSGRKRKREDVLRELMDELKRRYNIPLSLYNAVFSSDANVVRNARTTLAFILFDLKGAGDRLQIKFSKTARGNNTGTTFITNDRISSVLSYVMGKHGIRTAIKTDKRSRSLAFLNMQLNTADFKTQLIGNYLLRFQTILVKLQRFHKFAKKLKEVPNYASTVIQAQKDFKTLLSIRVNQEQGVRAFAAVDQMKWLVMYLTLTLLLEFLNVYGLAYKKDLDLAIDILNNIETKVAEKQNVDERLKFVKATMDFLSNRRFFVHANNFDFDIVDMTVIANFAKSLNKFSSLESIPEKVREVTSLYDSDVIDAVIQVFPCLYELHNLIKGATKNPWITMAFRMFLRKELNEVKAMRGMSVLGTQYLRVMENLKASPCWPAGDDVAENAILRTGGGPTMTAPKQAVPLPTSQTKKEPGASNLIGTISQRRQPAANEQRRGESVVVSATVKNNHMQADFLDFPLEITKQDVLEFKEILVKVVCGELRSILPPVDGENDTDIDDLIEVILVFLIKTTPTEVLLAQMQRYQSG